MQLNVLQITLLIIAAFVVVVPMAIVLVRSYGNVPKQEAPREADSEVAVSDVEFILTNSSCARGSASRPTPTI